MTAADGISDFYHLIDVDSVGSTSDELERLAAAGAAAGTLICARTQTHGHGRLGRSWISPPGNLYFSLLLRPECVATEAVQLTFVAAVALAEALAEALPAERVIGCKWPNDVLVDGRKIAGILLQSQADRRGLVDVLVIGIGVNVASHPDPEVVMYEATSVAAEGAPDETPRSILVRFCRRFQIRYEEWRRDGFQPMRAAWLSRADKLHRRVEIGCGIDIMAGIFRGLDASGAMVLEQDGRRRLILAGDVLPPAA